MDSGLPGSIRKAFATSSLVEQVGCSCQNFMKIVGVRGPPEGLWPQVEEGRNLLTQVSKKGPRINVPSLPECLLFGLK